MYYYTIRATNIFTILILCTFSLCTSVFSTFICDIKRCTSVGVMLIGKYPHLSSPDEHNELLYHDLCHHLAVLCSLLGTSFTLYRILKFSVGSYGFGRESFESEITRRLTQNGANVIFLSQLVKLTHFRVLIQDLCKGDPSKIFPTSRRGVVVAAKVWA